jgi:hypothetical protein
MSAVNRRDFLTTSASIGALSALSYARAADGPNEKIVLAIIGIGSAVPGSVGGRGRQLIRPLTSFKDAEIAYVCDVDENFFPAAQKLLTERQRREARTEKDLRRILEDKSVDAVMVATPDHWHALATIWACQAGKHVYVEKPASHNLIEGRRMVEAARRYNRVVQLGTQSRSSSFVRANWAKSPSRGHGLPGGGPTSDMPRIQRSRRVWTTISGSDPHRNGPSPKIVSITAGTGCGITAPASWATTAFTHSTGYVGCSTWKRPFASQPAAASSSTMTIRKRPTP